MNSFHKTALKLLTEYKALLKRQLTPEELAVRLAELHLNQRMPKNESLLFNLLAEVIKQVEADVTAGSIASRYSGNKQFLQHMKHVFACYRLENGHVIHVTQTASQAVIEAIQLITLPAPRLTPEVQNRLTRCADLIHKYGSEEQKSLFQNGIKAHLPRSREFFLPLLNGFQIHPVAMPSDWSVEEAVA